MALTMQHEFSPGFTKPGPAFEPRCAQPLSAADEQDVLEFLSARPIHTVFMASLIRDNGIVSPFNRGSFFGCRNNEGTIEGVALLGHATLIETENPECIKAFAELAKSYSPVHLIRGEKARVESFWSNYADGNRTPRLLCGEHLLELKTIPPLIDPVPGLRQATIDDLEVVVNVNASLVRAESGTDPLIRDPQGFRERSARRIRNGRVWVWIEESRLLYKTDIIAETPQAIYLEGVYVDPEYRTKGYGLRCISQLAALLLTRTQTICLTVNETAVGALEFYKRAGYELVSRYDTIYLDNSLEN